jgi:hypothetical protein
MYVSELPETLLNTVDRNLIGGGGAFGQEVLLSLEASDTGYKNKAYTSLWYYQYNGSFRHRYRIRCRIIIIDLLSDSAGVLWSQ